MAEAKTYDELRDASRALDRLVMHGHYQVPQLYSPGYAVSYWNKFGIPGHHAAVLHDRRERGLAGVGGAGVVEQECNSQMNRKPRG